MPLSYEPTPEEQAVEDALADAEVPLKEAALLPPFLRREPELRPCFFFSTCGNHTKSLLGICEPCARECAAKVDAKILEHL